MGKGTSDLMLVQSNLYQLQRGSLSRNPARPFDTVPLIKLGEHFKKVNNYLSRFKGIPNVLELDHLTVSGDVTIGKDVTLKGAVLENKVVSGNLCILDH